MLKRLASILVLSACAIDTVTAQERTQADVQIQKMTVTEENNKLVSRIKIYNENDDDASRLRLAITLPPEVAVVSVSPSDKCMPISNGTAPTGLVMCEWGGIKVGEIKEVQVITTIPPAFITNRKFGAFAYSNTPDPAPENNVASSIIPGVAQSSPPFPGTVYQTSFEASEQKPASVLIYNAYTSSAIPSKENTRVDLTNTNPRASAFVHLFFVANNGNVADSFICLTPSQTASFQASDVDPGISGYIVAVAVDNKGCPVNFNWLLGDEYVRFNTGHEANLNAIGFSALYDQFQGCDVNSVSAQINFNGSEYNPVPAAVAINSIGSRADGNDTMLILNRIGGNLGFTASTLGTLFGLLYDDAENILSYSVTGGGSQLRQSLSNNFPRTMPKFETFIPAGRTGWMAIFNQTGSVGMLGAAINCNRSGGYNGGHNLHHLSFTRNMSYTIPVFPPNC